MRAFFLTVATDTPQTGKQIVVIVPSFGERYLLTALFQNLWDDANAMTADA